MVSLVNTLSAAKLNGGAFLATCTKNLRNLASRIQQFFLKILQTILPCLFKKAVAKPLSVQTAAPQPQFQQPPQFQQQQQQQFQQQNPLSQSPTNAVSPSQVQLIDQDYFNGHHPLDLVSKKGSPKPQLDRTLTGYGLVGRKSRTARTQSVDVHPRSGFQPFSRQPSNTSESDERKSPDKGTGPADSPSNNSSSTRSRRLSPPSVDRVLSLDAYVSLSVNRTAHNKQPTSVKMDNNRFSLLADESGSDSAIRSGSASPRSVHSEKNKSPAQSEEE